MNVLDHLRAWAKQIALLRTIAQQRKLLAFRQGLFDDSVNALANRLRAGEISLADWQLAMKREIKDLHVTAGVIGKGGEWGAMTQSDFGVIGGRVRGQYNFLSRFADDVAQKVATGEDLTSAINVRAKMYGRASGATFNKINQSLRLEEGNTEAKWVLRPASDSCETCLDLAARDWIPVADFGGRMPRDGSTNCLVN